MMKYVKEGELEYEMLRDCEGTMRFAAVWVRLVRFGVGDKVDFISDKFAPRAWDSEDPRAGEGPSDTSPRL